MHSGPDGTQKEIHGTCFFVKSDTKLYVVTNRHNLDLAFKDRKYVGYRLLGFMISGYADNEHYYQGAPADLIPYNFPDNQFEDVAVFDLTDKQMQYRRKRKAGESPDVTLGPPAVFSIEASMLASNEDLQIMSAGTPILMPSYSLHYDRSSERPVMRGGIVASDPASDYLTEGQEPARRILFQAQSAEGASGAPVFALMDNEAVLLGVNAGQLLVPPNNVPSGFSYCFKATCVRECIEKFSAESFKPSPAPSDDPLGAGLPGEQASHQPERDEIERAEESGEDQGNRPQV
jgi:hypothetical protein